MRKTAVVAALLAAALPACNRDLTLPTRDGPTLTGIAPDHAFAGEELTLFGIPFDADPTANLVQFAGATSRGEYFNGDGSLVVKVPPDAGTGLLTVTTPLGASAPIGPFTYDGLGQLRLNAIAHEISLLHKPYKVVASGGETFIDSDLVVSFLRYGQDTVLARFGQSLVGLPWLGTVAWWQTWHEGATERSQLVRFDVATTTQLAVDVAPAPESGSAVPALVVALRSPDRVAMLRRGHWFDPVTAATLTVHDATTLATTATERALPAPIVAPHGCEDAGGGRIVCVFHEDFYSAARLALIVPGSPPTATYAAATASPIHHQPFSLEKDDPLCVAIGAAGHRVAAVGLEDGRLALVDLDAGLALDYVGTGSRTTAQSLTCPGSGSATPGVVLVAKTDDGLVTAVDVVTKQIRWAVPIALASRMSVDGVVIHAAGDADNVVSLLDLSTGQLLARRSFDPLPGREDGLQGAAWLDTGVLGVPVVVAAVEYPRGVLEVPVDLTGGQNRVYPWYLRDDLGIGVAAGIVSGTYLTLQETGLHVEDGKYFDHDVAYTKANGGFVDVGHDVQLATDGPADYHVGTWDGFVTIPYSGDPPTLSPIAEGNFVSLGVFPDPVGDDHLIYGAVNQWGEPRFTVQAWTLAAARNGNAATSVWEAPGAVDGAAVLQGTLWAFYYDGSTDHAVELTRDLAEVRDIAMNDFVNQIVTVSPNGRTFVSWENQPFSENTSIVVWSNDPDGSFPRAATIPIDGQIAGAAYDPTGERLFVLMRNPGRIVVLD